MLEMLDPGDTFVFAGQVWALVGVTNLDVLVTPGRRQGPEDAVLGRLEVRALHLPGQAGAPADVRPGRTGRCCPTTCANGWRSQRDRSVIAGEDEMLLETFPRGKRHFMVCYPFEGRLAHTTLAMLLTRRLERLGVGPLGFVCNDYALAVWALKPMDGLDFDRAVRPRTCWATTWRPGWRRAS